MQHVIISALVLFIMNVILACGDMPIESAQNFKANRAPVIVDFFIINKERVTVLPQEQLNLEVKVHEPDKDTFSCLFNEPQGNFNNQHDSSSGCTVTYTLPESLAVGMDIVISVTVTDVQGKSAKQDLVLPIGQQLPLLTRDSAVPNYMRSSEIRNFIFQADTDGMFQVHILDDINAPVPVFNEQMASYFYTKNTQHTISIGGSTAINVSYRLNPEGSTPDKVCIVFKDFFKQETSVSYVITIDDTPPTATFSSPHMTADRNLEFSFSGTDNRAVTDYCVSEINNPELCTWQATAPQNIQLSAGVGQKTVYAWVRDGAANISSANSVQVQLVAPGTEDLAGWNKMIQASPQNDPNFPAKIAIDSSNNIYIFATGLNLVSPSSSEDWWIKKFDVNGVALPFSGGAPLCQSSGNPSPCTTDTKDLVIDMDRYNQNKAIAVDSQNKVYIAGSSGNSVLQWRIKKFNPDGSEIVAGWNKAITLADSSWINALAIDSADKVYAVGFGPVIVSDSSVLDWLIKKFNSDGTSAYFSGASLGECHTGANPCHTSGNTDLALHSGIYDDARSAVIKGDYLYVAGIGENKVSASSAFDWWLIKFDLSGSIVWERSYHRTDYSDNLISIAVDDSHNIYVAGSNNNLVGSSTSLDWHIKKYDAHGTEVAFSQAYSMCQADASVNPCTVNGLDLALSNNINDADEPFSILVNKHNEIFIGGYGIFSGNGEDMWLMKFSSDGIRDELYGNKVFHDSDFDKINDMQLDSFGNVYMVGFGFSSAQFWWLKKLCY